MCVHPWVWSEHWVLSLLHQLSSFSPVLVELSKVILNSFIFKSSIFRVGSTRRASSDPFWFLSV